MDELDSNALAELLSAVGDHLAAARSLASMALAPSKEDPSNAAEWVAVQDASEAFKGMLEEVVAYVLARSSGGGEGS